MYIYKRHGFGVGSDLPLNISQSIYYAYTLKNTRVYIQFVKLFYDFMFLDT